MSAPQRREWHREETYKSLITISVECLKMLALVNGGAAVALLTYMGNLVSRSNRAPPHITPALLFFCGGLFAAVVAFILGYLVQLQLYNEETKISGGFSVKRSHQWFLWTAMLLVISAAVAFGVGCWLAASALGV
jgi:hypothetical protein